MKMIAKISALAGAVLMAFAAIVPASAAAYSTYTYSIDKEALISPDVYSPVMQIDASYMGLEKGLSNPTDVFCDDEGNIYLADADNDRIVILDSYYKQKLILDEFVNNHGVHDSLSNPNGVFVRDGRIYVADTDNSRIAVFKTNGEFEKLLEAPESNVFKENAVYKPVALAVDASGRIYVVSSSTYEGIIALNGEGIFQGFIGSQSVSYNAFEIIWRSFQTAEQRANSVELISTEYNNITIDDKGFIYVTTSSIAESDQLKATDDKEATYSPVKKLNSQGSDIMARNGFFGTTGEVVVESKLTSSSETAITGASAIVDVALGPEGTWSIIDEKRSKVYTYDSDGNLLFAFGDKGKQLGNIQKIKGLAYHGDDLLILDQSANNITLYRRTEYGNILINALKNDNDRNYDEAVNDWNLILQRNSNFDTAYVGIGKALYRSGDWTGAMEYYRIAYDTENYSQAFKMYRQDWVSKYALVIPVVVVVLCIAIAKFFGYAKKVNKKASIDKSARGFKSEILYAFHLIFHPFDGFWDLKHEKRGSLRGAIFYLVLATLTFMYQGIGKAYLFTSATANGNIWVQMVSLLIPLLLWVTANWCLTTLFDGEGSFKDIFIATCYSLVPIPMLIIPATLMTHIFTLNETVIITMLVAIAWVWVGLILFFGMMVTHDYLMGKNVLTTLGTIVGMIFIMFVVILFVTLLWRVVGFVSDIMTELSYRL